MSQIRVVIADDHNLMRSGLKLMLTSQADIQVVGEASDGIEAVELVKNLAPDLVLLDISMPNMNGLDCLRTIKQKYPLTKVILLTMYEDSQYLREGLANGANGYLLKKAADEVLFQAIKTVCNGDLFLQSTMAPLLMSQLKSHAYLRSEGTKPLSEQEKRVLGLMAMGYANSEIADQLSIRVKTVETYKYRVMEKLGVSKKSDLVKYAMKNGIIPDEQ